MWGLVIDGKGHVCHPCFSRSALICRAEAWRTVGYDLGVMYGRCGVDEPPPQDPPFEPGVSS